MKHALQLCTCCVLALFFFTACTEKSPAQTPPIGLYRGRGDEKDSSGPSPFLAILLIAAGAFNAAKPRTAWYLGYGWRFKDAEPSELALGVERMVGVVVLIIGVIMLLA